MINAANNRDNTFLMSINDLLTTIVKTIVNKPDIVRIEQESTVDNRHLFAIKVDEKDLGKVIGKNGQTIKSIRGLVNAINTGLYDIAVDVSS